jgi:hypothetical protein
MAVKTKKARALTLRDLLSRSSYGAVCKLLGPQGATYLREGGALDLDPGEDVTLSDTALRARVGTATVLITRSDDARGRLRVVCSEDVGPCVHAGAVLSLVLEEKMALGLSAPPTLRTPIESLSEEELAERALEERRERAQGEKMRLRSMDPSTPWTDYTVTSASSGKSYRVALRGAERGVSFCSCPDFRKNTLGTCKHILYVLDRTSRRFSAKQLATPFCRRELSVYLRYGVSLDLRLATPPKLAPSIEPIVRPLLDRAITDLPDLLHRLAQLASAGHDAKVYPDAEAFIDARMSCDRLAQRAREIRASPTDHALRTSLLETALLPYQLDGIAFAVGAGRAILADDMGSGRRSRGSAWRSCSPGRPASAACSSSARRPSSRSGGARSSASRSATASS